MLSPRYPSSVFTVAATGSARRSAASTASSLREFGDQTTSTTSLLLKAKVFFAVSVQPPRATKRASQREAGESGLTPAGKATRSKPTEADLLVTIEKRDETIEELHDTIEERDATIEKLHDTITERDDENLLSLPAFAHVRRTHWQLGSHSRPMHVTATF
jgi:hypothetical protein